MMLQHLKLIIIFDLLKMKSLFVVNFKRISLGNDKPILNLNFTAGLKNVFESDYEYYKINVSLAHKVPISPLGYFKYIIDAGQVIWNCSISFIKTTRRK